MFTESTAAGFGELRSVYRISRPVGSLIQIAAVGVAIDDLELRWHMLPITILGS